jgi:hypothetical protein
MYALPTNTDYVSCSWGCHRNRNPPSSEPGTDYASAYGSPLYAPATGRVADRQTSNANATGRFLTIDADDGRRLRSLHLSEIWVNVGDRVSQGQQVGKTGASGYGSDWGYGAHVHETLWSTHAYSFCSSCTLDFALYVGSAEPGPTQRVVGPNSANGRGDPSTAHPPTQTLPPGTVADFDGWISGEVVSGNGTWFRGAHSGDFFWSGGFTDTGTHDLADLNPVAPAAGNQRTVGANGANGRGDPSTNGPVTQTLPPGTVADMSGWITGQDVEGNTTWFCGAHSGDFFWSGGFTDTGTHDLADLNVPSLGGDRTVGENSANIRDLPYTTSPAVGSADGGAVVEMAGWTHAELVSGNDVWYQRVDGDWMWSGGFTSAVTDGLVQVPTPAPPGQGDVDNPRGLPTYAPVYPAAFQGLEAPLGFTDCQNPVTRTPRDKAGSDQHPVVPVIDTYVIHWTATLVDQMDWFSYCNSRSVCPTWYMRRDGSMSEMIRPGAKPAATGPDWNWRSVAVETLAEPGSDFTAAQWEAHAQAIAWLASFDGTTLDGVPVDFQIDRDHVIGHREAVPGTDCPGTAQMDGLEALLERARVIFEEGGGGTDPCAPDPNSRTVSVDTLTGWRDVAPWPTGEDINTVIASDSSGRGVSPRRR